MHGGRAHTVRESSRYRPRAALRERELAMLWQAQRIPPEALVAVTGTEVRVLYRGRPGAGPGPDFRDAVVSFDGAAPLRGDVELHLRSSDFRRHGHHVDRAYLRVVLHIVYEYEGDPTVLADGRTVPTVALERWVRRRAGELRAILSSPGEYREPCHTAVARLGAESTTNLLAGLGLVRLRARASALAARVEALGAEQTLYVAIARALGLTQNSEPMEAIALAMPLCELRDLAADSGDPALTVRAALLGAAGLLEPQLALWPAVGEAERERLLAAWQAMGVAPVPRPQWSTAPQRPGYGPRERLAGLAALVVRPGPPLDAGVVEWTALLAQGPRALLDAVQVDGLIGRDRALELLSNAVLPWLVAMERPEWQSAALDVYQSLSAPATYGRTRLLAGALRDQNGRTLLTGVATVQGALQMTHDWCTRGGCGRCPLS